MVGVVGSSPIAPTKCGSEIKHLAETPSAFLLLSPACRAPPYHYLDSVWLGRLRHADTRFARPGLRSRRPHAPRPATAADPRRRVLPRRREAHPGAALRRLPRLLRRTLPAQARCLGGHRARRQHRARLRCRPRARRRSNPLVRRRAAAVGVAREGLSRGAERALADAAGQSRGRIDVPHAGSEAQTSAAHRPGAGPGVRRLDGPQEQLSAHRGIRHLRAQVAAGRHALRPTRLERAGDGHRHELAGRRRTLRRRARHYRTPNGGRCKPGRRS